MEYLKLFWKHNLGDEIPVPTAEAFNSHELGNEFYACLISKEEFEQTWNGHYYYGKLDE